VHPIGGRRVTIPGEHLETSIDTALDDAASPSP
jgi:hypothetical protein